MEDQQQARPPDGLPMFLRLIGMQRLYPVCDRRVRGANPAKGRFDGHPDRRDEAALAEGAPLLGQQIQMLLANRRRMDCEGK
jgi:hypothetical protein